ncbi:MAG: hypothetical protein R3C03_00635 [Pirellulaceae bacterium]
MTYETLERRHLLASFTGTEGDDHFDVFLENGVPVQVAINGVINQVTDSVLELDTLEGSDEIFLLGEVVDVVSSYEKVQTFGSKYRLFLSINSDGINTQSTGSLALRTGDFDDTFSISGFPYLGTSQSQYFSIDTGNGDNVFEYVEGFVSIEMGDGNDTFISHQNSLAKIPYMNAGAGDDVITWKEGIRAEISLRGLDDNGYALLGHSRGYPDYPIDFEVHGFERLVGKNPSTSINTVFFDAAFQTSGNVDAIIVGNETQLLDADGNTILEIQDFSAIYGPALESPTRSSILSTDYQMRVYGFTRTEVGFHRDFRTGNLASIGGKLSVSGDVVVVSDYANPDANSKVVSLDGEQSIFPTPTEITGLAPSTISVGLFRNGLKRTMAVYGSHLGGNRYYLENASGNTHIYGGLQQDTFRMSGIRKKELGLFNFGATIFHGNGGADIVYVNNENSINKWGFDATYTLRNNSLQVFPNPTRNNPPQFSGLWFYDINRLAITGTSEQETFRVYPSQNTDFLINFGGLASGDRLAIPGTESFYLENGDTTIRFQGDSSSFRPIRTYGMFRLPMADKLVVATNEGSDPFVSVRNSATNNTLFEFDPFPNNPGFRGDLSVATGSLGANSIQDVAIGIASKGNGRVSIFDGVSGAAKATFLPFENYFGGVDIAIGNITGDFRNEIVVSKLSGENLIRVFEVDTVGNEMTFQKVMEYNPFSNAPGLGAKIGMAKVSYNYSACIIAALNPGWRPQIAVHGNVQFNAYQVARFLLDIPDDSDWNLDLTSRNVAMKELEKVYFSVSGSDIPSQLLVYAPESFPQNSGATVVAPEEKIEWSGSPSTPYLAVRDNNLDGAIDQIFLAPSTTGETNKVSILDGELGETGFVDILNDEFQSGFKIG